VAPVQLFAAYADTHTPTITTKANNIFFKNSPTIHKIKNRMENQAVGVLRNHSKE